jgi:hypothetical protein
MTERYLIAAALIVMLVIVGAIISWGTIRNSRAKSWSGRERAYRRAEKRAHDARGEKP